MRKTSDTGIGRGGDGVCEDSTCTYPRWLTDHLNEEIELGVYGDGEYIICKHFEYITKLQQEWCGQDRYMYMYTAPLICCNFHSAWEQTGTLTDL